MIALIFPALVSIVLLVWGVVVLAVPKLGTQILVRFNKLPIRTLGLLWLLLIVGLFISSYLAFDPIAVNLVGLILIFDALSLVFMPSYVAQIIILYRKMNRTYKSVYGFLSILLGLMLIWQFYLPFSEIAAQYGII